MKKIILSALALVSASAFACTNIIVGKAASADGSVFVSYNADSYGMYGNIYSHKGGLHQPGEERDVYDWDTNAYHGKIKQALRTYNVVGQMNENQVSVTETTFGGREDLWGTEGMLDYGSLIYIALERATSARDAIKIMTSLVDEYGYCSEGETFSICDKNEAWVMEMIGKGKGHKGAVWAAVHIPDDCVSAHANQSRITKLSKYDKKNVMFSKDLIKFAREKGYFSGKDADFSFRDAYSPNNFDAVRYCETRVWSIFNRMCDGMDVYVDYAAGKDMKGEMPLYMKPNHKITLRDVMNGMRDHYEGTPFDIQNELGAGPYNMPYRPTPLSWKSGDVEYFNERPVSTQQTAFCFVGQMRSALPDALGGIAWVTNDDPNMAPFVPLYCSMTDVPECFKRIDGVQDDVTFSWKSAFWLQNTVSNMVYPYYEKMFPDVKHYRDRLDDVFGSRTAVWEKTITDSCGEISEYTTNYSNDCAEQMMQQWTELFKYLTIRHNDMAIKKINGIDKPFAERFTMTKDGLSEAPDRPGYPEAFRKKIVESEGGKYKLK